MFTALSNLDKILLNSYERVGNWFQLRTNQNCFGLARLCCIGYLSFSVLYEALKHHGGESNLLEMVFLISMNMFVYGSIDALSSKVERVLPSSNFRNAREESFKTLRKVMLLVLTFGIIIDLPSKGIIWFAHIAFLFLLSALYFLSCTPLPPAARREYELEKASRLSLQT
jgi:predicted PurR-regulated permease PerM